MTTVRARPAPKPAHAALLHDWRTLDAVKRQIL